jgi:hypothetical protein
MPISLSSYGQQPMDVGALKNLDTPDLLSGADMRAANQGGIPGVDPANPYAQKLGMNLGTANLAFNGLSSLAGIWGAFKQLSLAKKDFNMRKEASDTNINNQIRSYNTALEDRSRSRAVMERQTPEQSQAYIDENKARRG